MNEFEIFSELSKRLEYDKYTGIFYFKKCEEMPAEWNKRYPGKIVSPSIGTSTNKYKRTTAEIGLNKLKVNVYLHRLAWFIVHKKVPDEFIDHIDGCYTNNKIENLRQVTASENQRNRKVDKRNSSGTTGVSFMKASKKWRAYLRLKSGRIWLGEFEKKEAAAQASINARLEHGFSGRHING